MDLPEDFGILEVKVCDMLVPVCPAVDNGTKGRRRIANLQYKEPMLAGNCYLLSVLFLIGRAVGV